jgi:hypothetical protein
LIFIHIHSPRSTDPTVLRNLTLRLTQKLHVC